jgi:hypothetical protein
MLPYLSRIDLKVLLAVATANHDLENHARAKRLYAELAARDPELARQHDYIVQAEQATRAADRASDARLEWMEE